MKNTGSGDFPGLRAGRAGWGFSFIESFFFICKVRDESSHYPDACIWNPSRNRNDQSLQVASRARCSSAVASAPAHVRESSRGGLPTGRGGLPSFPTSMYSSATGNAFRRTAKPGAHPSSTGVWLNSNLWQSWSARPTASAGTPWSEAQRAAKDFKLSLTASWVLHPWVRFSTVSASTLTVIKSPGGKGRSRAPSGPRDPPCDTGGEASSGALLSALTSPSGLGRW